jgi:uncharacterized membrane protein
MQQRMILCCYILYDPDKPVQFARQYPVWRTSLALLPLEVESGTRLLSRYISVLSSGLITGIGIRRLRDVTLI